MFALISWWKDQYFHPYSNALFWISVFDASGSPISWKKYPFLDIPDGGASARAAQEKKECL